MYHCHLFIPTHKPGIRDLVDIIIFMIACVISAFLILGLNINKVVCINFPVDFINTHLFMQNRVSFYNILC